MRNATLNVERFLQEPGECAVAAAATVANYYNNDVGYDEAREICQPDGDGMYTGDIARLLNRLGFKKVTVISADIHQLDFGWQSLSKERLIIEIKKASRSFRDHGYRNSARSYVKMLTDRTCDNSIIIDFHFGKYIRQFLKAGKPVLASFNWNLFFKFPKLDSQGRPDAIKGDYEEHEIVIVGYDDTGVEIVDSHHEMYTGKLSTYRSGRYRMDWETLHTVIGFGDVILPDEYDSNIYELVRQH